ncbi:MAG: DUF881 domain-containing protein [Actinobacteria bacterium]|nr:DUF881 domain-containing protein [Actinomycetota bacterium]
MGWAAVVPLVAVGAGLMFATSAHTSQGTDLRSSGRFDLVDVVRAQDRAVRERAAAVQQLQDQVDSLTSQAAPGNAEVARLRTEAAALAPSVGTQAVTGPALSVSLDDAKLTAASLPPGYTADDIVVHQQDVQSVVNALWAGGAEAMMLQDQRVISTSAVRCVGNTLILQGRVYSPPYVIQAIGDQLAMREALDKSPQVTIYRQYVDLFGLGYDVTSKAKATFPAYAGSLSLLNARTPG